MSSAHLIIHHRRCRHRWQIHSVSGLTTAVTCELCESAAFLPSVGDGRPASARYPYSQETP